MSQRLEGRTAIVVGAGQTPGLNVGNGRATALLMAREGAFVVAADRDLLSAQETVALIEAEGGHGMACQVDVTDEEAIRTMVSSTVETRGRIDVLHNNVGVGPGFGDAPVTEIEPEDFARLFAINLGGMVLACKHVLPVMREQRRGAIVNISSVAVLIDYPTVAYKTSKAGVVSLSEHLAIRNAEFGIRVNTILPGLIETPMAVEHKIGTDGRTRDDVLADRQARTPLHGHTGTAWDVAKAAVFLASDDSAFITGSSLVIDGGQSLVVG